MRSTGFSATPKQDPGVLLERAAELKAIGRAARAAAGGAGRVISVEGSPGIGKTALLDAGARLADEAGMRVLRARGSELERHFGFGVVGQLFGRVIREQPGLFVGPAALAASGLDPRSIPVTPSEASYAALHGLYWLTVDLAERGPLALLVDDAHWADQPSVRFLTHLAHRIDAIGVLVLAAARPAPGVELRALHKAELLSLKPLSQDATVILVRSLVPATSEKSARACHVATGGNAFYIHALARALRDDPDADAAAEDWSPAAITRVVGARLEMVSADARRLARATSILGPGAPLRHAAVLAQLDMTAAAAAVDTLSAAGVLAARGPLEFVHPIVRAAVRDGLGTGERSSLHRHAARLLDDEDAPVERIAVHLLHCEPAGDPRVVLILHGAARQALGRGVPEPAEQYLRRALEEPPASDAQVELLVDLAEAEALTFHPGEAAARLRDAHSKATDRQQRLDIASRQAVLLSHGAGASAGLELLVRARQEFAEDPDAVLGIDARIANVGRGSLSGRQLSLAVAERLRRADATMTSDPEVLAAVAAELAMVGEPAARVRELARRALACGDAKDEAAGQLAKLVAVRVLIVADDFDIAEGALSAALEDSRGRGSVLGAAFSAVFYAELLVRRGDLLGAEAEAHGAYRIVSEHGWPGGTPWLVASILHVLVERGRLDAADELLAGANLLTPASELSDTYTSNVLLAARGRMRAQQGRLAAALADLRECGRREKQWGELNPALIPWRSLTAEVLARSGELEEAHALALEELTLARQFAAPRALGVALRATARVTAGAEGNALAEEACDVLASSAARLDQAHALADLGQRRLAQGRNSQARPLLETALEHADRCGADALEDRVRTQLRAVGARPRRAQRSGPRSLTPSQRQIATLAALGQSNRQIAEALFLTQRTIEFHLGHAYRKLGISSRRELTDALADRPGR